VTGSRNIIACILCIAGFVLGAAGLWHLPAFGHYPGPYGDLINAVGVYERHATNVVTLVVFDYRGFDTLGEEYILFAAVIGAVVLLREHRGEEPGAHPGNADEAPIPDRSEAVAFASRLTPGGGFQGGSIVASATPLLYLGLGYPVWRRFTRSGVLDAAEAAGNGAFVIAGLAAMAAGAPFLSNLLPLGKTGSLVSAGVIPLLNIAVGIAVATGFATLFLEYLEETREPESGDER
jgi:multicomponent Na+:H+ antiporter subunit B